jgi:hypothetical protein
MDQSATSFMQKEKDTHFVVSFDPNELISTRRVLSSGIQRHVVR